MADLKDILGEDGVEVGEVAAGTIVRDKRGHEWTIPDGKLECLDDLYGDITIPKPEDGFAYQYVRENRLREALLKGWVTVDREEIGIPLVEKDNEGVPVSSIHQVNDAILVKIPKELHKLFMERKEKNVKDELSEVARVDQRIEESGFVASSTLEHKSDPISG